MQTEHMRRARSSLGACGSKRRTDKWIRVAGLVALLGAVPPMAFSGQTSGTPFRIGVLTAAWGPPGGLREIVNGLVRLGYRENEDFVIGVRYTSGDVSALGSAAAEMVAGGVDLLVAAGPADVEAAKQATSILPIVFLSVGDPIARGFIRSYARPGGNITGVADLNFEISGKRLQMFKELIPKMRRVLLVYNKDSSYQAAQAEQYRHAAERLKIELVERPVGTIEEAAAILGRVSNQDFDGLLAPSNVDLDIPGLVIDATKRQRIPSMFDHSVFLEGVASLAMAEASTLAVIRSPGSFIRS